MTEAAVSTRSMTKAWADDVPQFPIGSLSDLWFEVREDGDHDQVNY